jgi:hypothetical protein
VLVVAWLGGVGAAIGRCAAARLILRTCFGDSAAAAHSAKQAHLLHQLTERLHAFFVFAPLLLELLQA